MATEAESLATLRDTIIAQLTAAAAAAPLGVSVSENGRSISLAELNALQQRLDWINIRLAQISGPFSISSTGVNW
jgi:hypothetical protein